MANKKIWSMLLIFMTLLVTLGSGIGGINVIAQDGDKVTRIQWLSQLTTVFEMTVEEDNYPDNYYSDINSASEYYHYVMLATEFGLVDVEAGEQFKPDEPATREFAAHTLNLCMGYVLDEQNYTFNERESVTYADDIQIAINHGWISLNEGNFMPEQGITTEEQNVMINAAKEAVASTVQDENHVNVWEYAEDVMVLPETVMVEAAAENQFMITNADIELKAGDIVGFVRAGMPFAYKIEEVSGDNENVIITTSDVKASLAFKKLDVQGNSDVDLAQIEVSDENAQITYIVGDKEFVSKEEVGDSEVDSVWVTKTYKLDDEISKQFDLGTGATATLKFDISDVSESHYSSFEEAYAIVSGTIVFDCNVSMDVLEAAGISKSIELAKIPVCEIMYIKTTLEMDLSGEVTTHFEEYFSVGVKASSDDGVRFVKSFNKKAFTINAEVDMKLALKVEAVVDLLVLEGAVWSEFGFTGQAKVENFDDGQLPTYCTHFSMYMYTELGARLDLDIILLEEHWSDTLKIYDAYNSPVRVRHHYEDGMPVSKCTRDATSSSTTSSGSSKYKYYTPITSKYSYSGASSGVDAEGNEYKLFDYELDDNNNATITGYYGYVSALKIPAKLDGYRVVAIGNRVFEKNLLLRSVVIPDSVTHIGNNAFSKCVCLGSVILPKNLEKIDYQAFYDCDALESIEIPKSLAECRNALYVSNSGAFNGCDNLKTVTFEEGTTRIVARLFMNCPGIEEIVIPEGVTVIEATAFEKCVNLRSIKLSNTLLEINSGAFRNCKSLSGIVIPDSVKVIKGTVFENCERLSDVTLSNSLEVLDYGAFVNCDSLTDIVIPKSIIKSTNALYRSDDGPFNDCDNLKTVTIEKGCDKIVARLFANCSGIETVIIPEGVKVIEEYAFCGADNLTEIVIPEGVTEIKVKAFAECASLTKITIPKQTTTIASNAFSYPENLTIYGVVGSYAQEYALANNIAFVGHGNVDQVEAFVERMYTVALSHAADPAGVENWVTVLKANTHDGAGIAKEFILGAEFALYNYTNEQYIDILYNTFFDRPADEAGKELWLLHLNSGFSRAYVLSNFVNLEEFTMVCDRFGIERGVMLEDGTAVNPGIPQFVKRLYLIALDRSADNAGLKNYVMALLVKAETAESVAKNFLLSAEYEMRGRTNEEFVTDLYAVFMNRTPDADGIRFWVDTMALGMTKEQAIVEFAKSAEFRQIAAGYGL